MMYSSTDGLSRSQWLGVATWFLAALLCTWGERTTLGEEGALAAKPGDYLAWDKTVMVRVPDGSITVDGDLSEWAEVPHAYLDPRLMPEASRKKRHPDRATAQLALDSSTLYVAIRVVDEEVVNPFEPPKLWQGDGVSLFLDVRPEEGAEGLTLGTDEYTPGCYQIHFVPVNAAGESEARRHFVKEGDPPQNMHIATRLLEDGYTFEIAIPFSDMTTDPARFERPIGFDLRVFDAKRAGAQPAVLIRSYSWQRQKEVYQHASYFGRALPVPAGAPMTKAFRYLPLRFDERAGARSFAAGFLLPLEEGLEPPELELSFRYEGSRADRPEKEEDWEVPQDAKAPGPRGESETEVAEDPVLGIRMAMTRLSLSGLIGGRYTVTADYQVGERKASETLRAYYYEGKGRNRMEVLARDLQGQVLTDAVAAPVWLGMDGHHVFDDAPAEVNVKAYVSSGGPQVRWGLSELAETPGRAYGLRLDVSELEGDGTPVWSKQQALELTGAEFTIPVADLAEGNYAVRAKIMDPDGKEHKAWSPGDNKEPARAPTCILGVHRDRDYMLRSSVMEAEQMLTRAVPVGDPHRAQFPKDDKKHCFARSVWDFQAYDGRIYTGCGDWGENQGPIDIWSFGPPPAPGEEPAFQKEFRVDDESVDRMRVLDGRLVVPGIDARESWQLGNIYIKEAGQWRKIRTVPNGIHVFDAALFRGKLYVGTGTEAGAALFESADWGQSWTRHSTEGEGEFIDNRYYGLAALGDRLLVTVDRAPEYMYVFDGSAFERVVAPFCPGLATPRMVPKRLIAFGDGVLYTPWWTDEKQAKPLYYVRDPAAGALLVEALRDKRVQDVIVRGEQCYVLTSSAAEEGFESGLYASTDLSEWTQIARFTTPALAHSVEELDGTFYVGLADIEREANPASGLICRLE